MAKMADIIPGSQMVVPPASHLCARACVRLGSGSPYISIGARHCYRSNILRTPAPVREGVFYAMGHGTAHLHMILIACLWVANMSAAIDSRPHGPATPYVQSPPAPRTSHLEDDSKRTRRGRPRATTLFLSSSVVCGVSQLSTSRRPQRRYLSLGPSPSSHFDTSANLSISRPAPRGAGARDSRFNRIRATQRELHSVCLDRVVES